MFSSIKEAEDLSPFKWIEDGLRSPIGQPPEGDTALRTLDLVPPRFAAYGKVFHPIYENPEQAGQDKTWDQFDRETPEERPVAKMIQDATTHLRSGVGGVRPRGWRRVLWSDLADQFGLSFGPEFSEKDLDRAWPGGSWPARLIGPDEGDLTLDVLGAIVRAIQEEGDPGRCYFWWWMVACMQVFKPERDYLVE